MKKALALAILAAAFGSAQADTYKIDSHHTNARFAIDHFNTSTNTGGFYNLSGTVEYNPQAKTGSVKIDIPVANLRSGNEQFDHHLASADLFNAAQYPSMRFESTRFNFRNGKLASVDGRLTLLGQTHPVRLNADRFNCYHSQRFNAQVCGGDFSTTIDRSKFGMNFLQGVISNQVKLNIQIEAVKQ